MDSETVEEIKRHFGVVTEGIRSDIRAVAEGQVLLGDQLTKRLDAHDARFDSLERRVDGLERKATAWSGRSMESRRSRNSPTPKSQDA
jgi:hypothetical protein